MGIFKNDQTLTGELTLESLVYDRSPWYLGEDYLEGALDVVIDMTENYNMIQKEICINELSHLEEYKEDIVYNEASVQGFILAIKKFLYRIWEKLSSLFKSFMMFIDKQTKSDRAFLEKYKKEVYGKNLTDFEFDGFVFTIETKNIETAMQLCNNMPGGSNKDMANLDDSKVETHVKNTQDPSKAQVDMETTIETLRGNIVHTINPKVQASKLSQSDFVKDLYKAFRDGEEDKTTLDNSKINVGTIGTEMQTSKDTRKKVQDMYRAAKRIIDDASKQLEYNQKSLYNKTREDIDNDSLKVGNKDKKGKDAHNHRMTTVNYLLTWTHRSKSLLLAINGAALGALRERSKQNKALIAKIANYKYEPK